MLVPYTPGGTLGWNIRGIVLVPYRRCLVVWDMSVGYIVSYKYFIDNIMVDISTLIGIWGPDDPTALRHMVKRFLYPTFPIAQ